MASLSSMCSGPFTTARITAIAAIVGFTSGGATYGISAAVWASSFAVVRRLLSRLLPGFQERNSKRIGPPPGFSWIRFGSVGDSRETGIPRIERISWHVLFASLIGFDEAHCDAGYPAHNLRLAGIGKSPDLAFRIRMWNRGKISPVHLTPAANILPAQF